MCEKCQQVADDVRAIRDLLDTLTPPAPVPDPVPEAPVEVRGDGQKGWPVMADPAYNPSTPEGRVRLLIDDTHTVQVFTTDEIAAFLDMNAGSVPRAAAQALMMIAGSEARLSKKITTQDVSTDGPAVAKELRELAKQLRSQADQEDEAAAGSYFGIVEYPYSRTGHPELAEGSPW